MSSESLKSDKNCKESCLKEIIKKSILEIVLTATRVELRRFSVHSQTFRLSSD